MPARISPTIYGARSAKELLYRIRRINALKGEPDLDRVSSLLEEALQDPRTRRGILLVLTEFISVALEGSAIRLEEWTPLELFDPESRSSTTQLKRG